MPWTSRQPLDVASPQFDSAQPATWNYAAPERRVFGLAVRDRRLYYAVADGLQIWSVGLNADGSFGNDAVIELAAPPSTGPTEISKITFDEQGRMFLADRPAPTGAFDFEALAVPTIGRVLRYALIEIMPNGRHIWQLQPDEYAIGFPPDFRNGNGGVAIGYNYDQNGTLLPGSCGGFMWTTGEDLRQAADAALAARSGNRARWTSTACKATARGASDTATSRHWKAISSTTTTNMTTRRNVDIWATSPSSGCVRRRSAPISFRTAAHRRWARAAKRTASPAGRRRRRSAGTARHAAKHSGPAAEHAAGRLPARPTPARRHQRVRELRSARRADQRHVLQRDANRGHRRLFEFELPGRADSDRAKQLLLQQQPGLRWRGRRTGLLQQRTRQRSVSLTGRSADNDLRQGLRTGRRHLLSRQPDDLDRGLLPGRTSAERSEQKPVRPDRAHSNQTAARSAMLRLRHSDCERKVLSAGERHDERASVARSRSIRSTARAAKC